jgi:ELWxxDGT repeat protein
MVVEPGNLCFFVGTPRQLWCSDGTASGTRAVGPVLTDPRLEGTIESGLEWLAGQVYFCNGGTPTSLFSLNEQRIAEIPLDGLGIQGCSSITAAAGRIWFEARVEGRRWLAVSDGTPAGTLRLAELPSWVSSLTAIGGTVLFVVERDTVPYSEGRELWRSDGTVSGTRPLFELAPYPAASDLVVAGGRVWFAGIDREHGVELWSTDGTAAGTRLETDLAPGPAWSTPQSLLPVGDKLYFLADDTERSGIWVLDLD